MRVLLTNNTLDERAGSELYVRDVALELLRRGHEPIAYSTRLGDVARELRAATVPVIDDLDRLARPPDIIHGQHHLDAMAAMLRFPEVPAIYYCHGFMPWQEMPIRFPSILAYVAVDDLCRIRLESEHGIPPERIHTIRNFVDLPKFARRGPLPETPRRALVFSNTAREDGYIGTIRRVADSLGVELSVVGSGVGRVESNPERILGRYDVVFAKARAALEALATGNAVITCDSQGLAGMVTPENVAELRRLNFGVRTLSRPITEENVRAEFLRYDAQAASTVTDILRAEVGLDLAVDAIVALYEKVVATPRSYEPEESLHSASRYLASVGDIVKGSAAETLERNLSRADAFAQRQRAEGAERERDRATSAREATDIELREARTELAILRVAIESVEARRAEAESRLVAVEDALRERNVPWTIPLAARRVRKVLWKQPLAKLLRRRGK